MVQAPTNYEILAFAKCQPRIEENFISIETRKRKGGTRKAADSKKRGITRRKTRGRTRRKTRGKTRKQTEIEKNRKQ